MLYFVYALCEDPFMCFVTIGPYENQHVIAQHMFEFPQLEGRRKRMYKEQRKTNPNSTH